MNAHGCVAILQGDITEEALPTRPGLSPNDQMTGYPASPKTIGEMIRKRRLDLGLLQREVAERIGCNKMTMANWERGHTTPQIAHMAQIVAFVGSNPFESGSTIGERLVKIPKERGNTQKVFAAQIGVDQNTLAKWERGEREPRGRFARLVEVAMVEDH